MEHERSTRFFSIIVVSLTLKYSSTYSCTVSYSIAVEQHTGYCLYDWFMWQRKLIPGWISTNLILTGKLEWTAKNYRFMGTILYSECMYFGCRACKIFGAVSVKFFLFPFFVNQSCQSYKSLLFCFFKILIWNFAWR